VVLSDCGWNVVDKDNLMPSLFKRAWNEHTTNCSPQSEIILSGSPNHRYRCVRRIDASSSAVIVFLHSTSMIPLVSSWSTVDRILSNPFDVGRLVMKSIEH